jgi:hypothetical protein
VINHSPLRDLSHFNCEQQTATFGSTHQMRDFGAANLILTRHAGDVRTGSADPPPLHDGSPSARSRHMPSDELATCATAKDQDFESFRLRHALSPCADSPASLLWTWAAYGAISGCCCRRSSDKVPNGRCDFRAMRFQCEVARIEEANVRTGDVTPVGFGPWGQEERIVAPPHSQ